MLIITKHHCCPNLRGSDVNGVSAWVFCVTNKIPAENENSGFRTEIFLFYMTFYISMYLFQIIIVLHLNRFNTQKSYILISQNVAFNLEGKVKIDIFKKHRDYSQLNLVSRVNSYFCTIGQQSFPMLSRLKSINNAAFT